MKVTEALLEQSQEGPKYFKLPDDKVLYEIAKELKGALPLGVKGKIYFTGSAALARMGAMDREMKDIDVVIHFEEDWTEDLKQRIRPGLKALPEATGVNYGPLENIELQMRFKLQGYMVEVFLSAQKEETIDIALYDMRVISFARIDNIFKRKWECNPDKALKDTWNVRDHIQKHEPKERKERINRKKKNNSSSSLDIDLGF